MQKLGTWLKRRFEAAVSVVVSLSVIPGAVVDYYAIQHVTRQNPPHHLKQSSETTVTVVCLILTCLLAVINYLSVPGASFILFG